MQNSASAHSGCRDEGRATWMCGRRPRMRACRAPSAPACPCGSTEFREPVLACVGPAPLVRPRAPAEAGVCCKEAAGPGARSCASPRMSCAAWP